MRVLHFGRFYNDQFGGLERHVNLLLRGLEPYCQSDNLVAHDHYAQARVETNGYVVYKVPSLGKLAGTAMCPTMPSWARRLQYQHDYDIVHLHFPDPMAHLASVFLPSPVKRVITWHSDIVRQKWLFRFYQPFLSRILNRADAIIIPTPQHLESSTQLTACRYPERFHIVPFGMDYTPFENAATHKMRIAALRTELGVVGDSPLIFTVGRHVYYKGMEYLIRAMTDISGARLVIGGEGPLTADMRLLAQALELTSRIRFVGRISDAELPFYYHACDVFCMPSILPAEAFGLVQLEAMACGKPVVCCNLQNGVNYVNRDGETGLVVPPRNPQALAAAINSLLINPDFRQRLGEQGRHRARTQFSLDAMVAGTLAVYERVLGKDVGASRHAHPGDKCTRATTRHGCADN